MGRMTIKRHKKRIRVPYDAEFNELKEWQDNMYNPGHYIGTGRMSYPMKMLAKRPKLKWAYLAFVLGPGVIFYFFTDYSEYEWYYIIPAIIVIAVMALIIWDSKRTLKKIYKR